MSVPTVRSLLWGILVPYYREDLIARKAEYDAFTGDALRWPITFWRLVDREDRVAYLAHFIERYSSTFEQEIKHSEYVLDEIVMNGYGWPEDYKTPDEMTAAEALWRVVVARVDDQTPREWHDQELSFGEGELDAPLSIFLDDFEPELRDRAVEWYLTGWHDANDPKIKDGDAGYRATADEIAEWVGWLEQVRSGGISKTSSAINKDPAKRLLAWLEDEHQAPTTARFVALVLLLHRNAKSGQAWPSKSTIAAMTGLSERAVYDALKWLTDKKVIEKVKAYQSAGRYSSTVYRFTRKTPI